MTKLKFLLTLHEKLSGLPLEEVARMSDTDYCPQGCTALLDAVGDAIHQSCGV